MFICHTLTGLLLVRSIAVTRFTTGELMINRSGLVRKTYVVLASTTVLAAVLVGGAAHAAAPDSVLPSVSSQDCGHGYAATVISPAAGFDPLTATPEELSTNGFPQRPLDVSALKSWVDVVSKPIRSLSSCSILSFVPTSEDQPGGPNTNQGSTDASATTPCDTSTKSCNWDGNVARESFTQAEAAWTVPYGSGPDTSDSSQWVGIGQGNSPDTPMAQAGTEVANGGLKTYAWTEVVPTQATEISRFSIPSGHHFAIHVSATSTGAGFHLTDESAGTDYSYSWTGPHSFDGTAEWIDERPLVAGRYTQYTHQNVTFSSANAYQSGSGWSAVGNTTHTYTNLWDCEGLQLAATSAISPADTYSVDWRAYGQADLQSSCS